MLAGRTIAREKRRPLLVRVANAIGKLGFWAFTPVFGRQYGRFLRLRGLAEQAFERGKFVEAATLAEELLATSEKYRDDWNYGNALHAAHILLGRIRLKNGSMEEASEHLLMAGRTPDSPQLNSFGPNMRLAMELINIGERAAVLRYFDLCRQFWPVGNDRLNLWSSQVLEGEQPDFGPNL